MSKNYPLHPITNDWANLQPDERTAMKADLRKNGLRTPILVWEGQIVDGKHRLTLLRKLKREPTFDTKTLRDATEKEMEAHVRSLNQFRRSQTKRLTNDEKHELAKAELLKDPTRADNAIAKALSIANKTVTKIRRKLEADSNLGFPKLTATKGQDGKTRRRPMPPPPRRPEPANDLAEPDPAPTADSVPTTAPGRRSRRNQPAE